MNLRGRATGAILGHRHPERARREENVVPMINVIFLLLLFFMVAGNLNPDSDPSVQPPISASEAELPRNMLEISIDAGGAISLYGKRLAPDALAGSLLVDGVPPKAVRIKADQSAAAGDVTEAIDRLAAVGVEQLILVTVRSR